MFTGKLGQSLQCRAQLQRVPRCPSPTCCGRSQAWYCFAMSKNPPLDEKPATAKTKTKAGPRGPATKAEHAALKRVDKMVIKRMRKR